MMEDSRQQQFSRVIDQIKKLEGLEKIQSNNTENLMRAASVDLGRLQDTIMELMEKNELKDDADIAQFVANSVQRPKRVNVDPWTDDFNKCIRYSVTLMTKDDFGYYEYKFTTRLTNTVRARNSAV